MRRLLLPLALVAVLAAGCGGSTKGSAPTAATTTTAAVKPQKLAKAGYVSRMRVLGHRLGVMVEAVYPIDSGTPHSKTSRDTVANLEQARVKVESVLASLRAIVPPKAVRPEHLLLEQGVRGMADEMEQVIVALRKGDIAASIAPASLPSLRVVSTATDRMEKKGYDVLNRAAGPVGSTAPSG